MAGYGDNETNLVEDEYDDLDDFIIGSDDEGENVAEDEVEEELPEAEEEEVEEEYEEEEEEEPPVGTQEILSFREQLKAKLRKQHQSNGADNGNPSCSSSDQPPVRSRFGTFFGPSTPVLAPRLIEAGCSSIMKENQNLPSRKHAAPSSASEMQPSASAHEQKPKIVPQVKRKVDTLRENRDYSNLFSDDADAPPPTEERAESKPVMATKSDVEAHRMKPIQSAATNKKVPTNHPARPSKDHGSIQSRVQNKVVSQVKKEPLPNGRKPIAAARNGSRPPNGTTKARPGLQPSSNGQNPQRSMQSKIPQTLPAAQRQQRRPPKPQGQRQQNHIPSSPQVRRMNSSVQGQQPAHKGSALPRDRTKLGQKQLAPSSRPKPSPISAVYSDPAKKKGVVKRKLSDAEKVRQMVRDVLNYDPGKYSGKDDDDSDMEAGYASIQMEERRSAKIARAEDEEQYRLIQQEEQSERAKKKKQRTES